MLSYSVDAVLEYRLRLSSDSDEMFYGRCHVIASVFNVV